MATTGYADRDVHVRGLKLHYQEWGDPSSTPILMLHGFGVSGHMFDEFAERMQGRFRLIALDQRGHGDSDWSAEGDYSRDAFVEDVEAFRQALGLERFYLVGHSMGGLNSVAYTVAHPDAVKALVLVDVGPEAAKEGVDNIVRFTRGPDELEFEQFVQMAHQFNQRRTLENIRERMQHRLKPSEDGKWTWKFDRRFREKDSQIRIGSELSNDEMWQLFRAVAVPTLLVRGGESDVLTAEVAERAVREMPNTRLVTVPGAGHSVPGDNPDDFTLAVSQFLEDVARDSFAAAAANEPPPLAELVEAAAQPPRRRAPMLAVALAAGTALVVVIGAVLASRQANARKVRRAEVQRQRQLVRRRQATVTVPAVDVDLARERAAHILSELGHVSRENLARARTALQDVDVDRARAGAEDVLAALGERTRHAPEAVKTAVRKVEARRPRARRKRSRTAMRLVMRVAVPMVAASLGRRGRARKRAR